MLLVERGQCAANATSFADRENYHGFMAMNYFPKADCDPQEEDIDRALNTAARMLTDLVRWSGCRRKRNQYLAWPRNDAHNSCTGGCVSCCEIPREIVEANIILAHQILIGEVTPFTSETNAKVQSMSMDKYSVTFAGGGAAMKQSGDCGGVMTISADKLAAVRHLIKCYTKGGNGIRIRRS